MKVKSWCQALFSKIHKTRSRTFGVLVEALIRSNKIGVCSLGRHIKSNTSIKHSIKRVHRFISNDNVNVNDFLKIFIESIINTRESIIVAVDWTKVRERAVLVCGLISKGRVIPIYWKVADSYKEYNQNLMEDSLFHELKSILPKDIEIIIVADRGFHRVSLLKVLDNLGYKYIIRQPSTPFIYIDNFEERLKNLDLRLGDRLDIPYCQLKKGRKCFCRLVVIHDLKQKEAWFLSTNLNSLTAEQIIKIYSYRFRIEESFRDIKGVRDGWHLKQIGVKNGERLSRLLLIGVIGYYFVLLSGIITLEQKKNRNLASVNRKKNVLSIFQIGKITIFKLNLKLKTMLIYIKALIVRIPSRVEERG